MIPIAVLAAVFPVIFIAELPDKTMFASLILSTRGRPVAVWIGAALAFIVHVAIAVTIGATLFAILPRRAVEGVVALMFLGGAVFAFRDSIAARRGGGGASHGGRRHPQDCRDRVRRDLPRRVG